MRRLFFTNLIFAEKAMISKSRMIFRQNNCLIILPKNYSACLVPDCPAVGLGFANFPYVKICRILSKVKL
jgi:hypothetical protein